MRMLSIKMEKKVSLGFVEVLWVVERGVLRFGNKVDLVGVLEWVEKEIESGSLKLLC